MANVFTRDLSGEAILPGFISPRIWRWYWIALAALIALAAPALVSACHFRLEVYILTTFYQPTWPQHRYEWRLFDELYVAFEQPARETLGNPAFVLGCWLANSVWLLMRKRKIPMEILLLPETHRLCHRALIRLAVRAGAILFAATVVVWLVNRYALHAFWRLNDLGILDEVFRTDRILFRIRSPWVFAFTAVVLACVHVGRHIAVILTMIAVGLGAGPGRWRAALLAVAAGLLLGGLFYQVRYLDFLPPIPSVQPSRGPMGLLRGRVVWMLLVEVAAIAIASWLAGHSLKKLHHEGEFGASGASG